MSNIDTSTERVEGYAKWNENEARDLRLYREDAPDMPELAEMHEETAATLRALAADRDAAQVTAANNWQHYLDFKRAADRYEADRDRLAATCRDLIKAANDWEQKYLTAAAERDAAVHEEWRVKAQETTMQSDLHDQTVIYDINKSKIDTSPEAMWPLLDGVTFPNHEAATALSDAIEVLLEKNAQLADGNKTLLEKNTQLKEALRALAAERDRLAAENAKLRGALEKIANRNPNAVGGGRRAVEYDAMRREARAALAGDTP
jgi:uncharacterized phage infection (PIP) family protein YhgE